MIENINQKIHKLQSCTSSNPGHPDSDRKDSMIENINQKIHKLQSCTSSNPGHPDSDKKIAYFLFLNSICQKITN
jgi:hypothetical protein